MTTDNQIIIKRNTIKRQGLFLQFALYKIIYQNEWIYKTVT